MKHVYIIKWKDINLEGWTGISNTFFTNEIEAHRFAQRWIRLYADDGDRYRVIKLMENWDKYKF